MLYFCYDFMNWFVRNDAIKLWNQSVKINQPVLLNVCVMHWYIIYWSLQWRHNERDGVSNHQPRHCFTQPFIQAKIKENFKVSRHWPLFGEFPAQMVSNAENVSIWWRHHDSRLNKTIFITGLILYWRPANRKRRYFVTTPFIGGVQT